MPRTAITKLKDILCSPVLKYLHPLLSLSAVLAAWSLFASSGFITQTLFPPPSHVWAAAVEMAESGLLLTDLKASISRACVGFFCGASLGILVGVVTGHTYLFRVLLYPFLRIMRPIPAIAIVPVAIVWFGIGEESKYFVISYTVFLSVWFNTHQGIEYVASIYIKASRSLGASQFREFFTVVIPAAAPHIVTGVRLGVALSLLSLVAAELTGAASGIGYRLQDARQYIRMDRMFALLIELGLLGALVDFCVHRISKKIVHWEQA